MKRPIYLDYHATTPVDPRVLEAMLPFFGSAFGNAASRNHLYGWEAEAAVDEGRAKVASLLGADPQEIVFTSGATESDNLAIFGVARLLRQKGDHLVTATTEHKAVLDSCRELEREGFCVTYLAPAPDGSIDPEQVREALTEETILVSLMLANNEIGTIHDLSAIGEICRERGVLFHSDAVQGIGKIPFDVATMPVDLVSATAHKLCGPKGVGALYVRSRRPHVRLQPLLYGGGQEKGLRSGTLNVPGIVGFGRACEIAGQEREDEARRLRKLRQRLFRGLSGAVEGLVVNGPALPKLDDRGEPLGPETRLPGNLNVSFPGVDGEALFAGMRGVAVSSGAACTSAAVEPSHVLKAIGVPDELALSAMRFGLGRFTTEAEIDSAAAEVASAYSRISDTAARGAV
jgi:cysteine desulfurase